MGAGITSFIKVVLKNFDILAGPFLSLVYPLYASVRANESKPPVDDQQWLTYWINLGEREQEFVFILHRPSLGHDWGKWVPIWLYAKLILTCWLVIPYFSGAAYVYEHFVRPIFVNPLNINIWYVPKKMDPFSKSDEILTAAEKYIAEHGTQELKNLIHRADKSRKNNSYYL